VLFGLQVRLGLSYLFISHDLSVVRQFADTVTVLRDGAVQEQGTTNRVFTNPASEYTQALVDSIPRAL
ncbi:MAG: peptide/nickel transport system ATP-binding protein ddpF, partial [Mycobacterium sp.]|nr:peptide/nickel transport system ATP-binding protein ddpF [Mycobacterium sp.]